MILKNFLPIFLVIERIVNAAQPPAAVVTFFGGRTDISGGSELDSFISRYFFANFGNAGIEYLREVADVESKIGGKISAFRGTDVPSDIEFMKNLKKEISEIVGSFSRMDMMNSGLKAIGRIKPDTLSSVETEVHYRLHRFIGLLDYMKSHKWNFDNNRISYKDNVDQPTQKELKILLAKFKFNFAGNQDKIPSRFYKDSLKLIGMLSWPSTDIKADSLFKFLSEIFTAAKSVQQPRNLPIEDIRYTVFHKLLSQSIGTDGIVALQDERFQFFSQISSSLLFTGFSVPFSPMFNKCSPNFATIVTKFEKSFVDLVRIVAAIVTSSRREYQTIIGSTGTASVDCERFTGTSGLLAFVTRINCFVKSSIPPEKAETSPSCGLPQSKSPPASGSKPATVVVVPSKPEICGKLETLTSELDTALKPHLSMIVEQ